jgi:hypothetical protein
MAAVAAVAAVAATVAVAAVVAMVVLASCAGRRSGVGVCPDGHARRECDDHGQDDPQ